MKKSLAIDTLRFAKRLEEAGTPRPTADAMADALNDELVDHQLTKADLAEALLPIHKQLAAADSRFDAMDAKIDSKFNELDGKIDSKFNELDGKVDSKFNELDAKFDAKFGALSTKLSLGLSLVSLMFTAFVGLAGAMLVRTAPPAPAPAPVEQPAEATVSPVGTASSPPAQEEPSSE